MDHPIPIQNEDSNKAEATKSETLQKNSVQDPKPDPAGEGGDAEVVKLQSPSVSTSDMGVNYKGNENASDTAVKANLDTPRSRKSVTWSQELVMEPRMMMHSSSTDNSNIDNFSRGGANPYVSQELGPPPPSYTTTLKNSMDTVRDVLGRWGKRVGEATKKAEDLAGNTWQHLKTSPSFADAAVGRIAQGTKVLAEGGYEKIFQQTFETAPEEQLQDAYACYLSTSAGPVMGILYISTAKIGFCSDNPLSYKSGDKTEWSYYKVVIPLHQLKAVNPSTSRANPAEKYVQVISVDNHEFWYMGFLNYDGVVKCLQDALETRDLSV